MPSGVSPKPPHPVERFTQRARRAMTFAQEAAENFQHSAIGSEHLLLGLLREGEGVAGHVLRQLGVQQAQLEEAVKKLAQARVKTENLNLAPGVKKALEAAVYEARGLGHNYVGTEHLLLGLVHHQDSSALNILKQFGHDETAIRAQTLQVLQQRPSKTWQHELDVPELSPDILAKYRLRIELIDKSTTSVKFEFHLSLSQVEQYRRELSEKIARAMVQGDDISLEIDTPQGKVKWYGVSLYEFEQYRKALFGPLTRGKTSQIEIDSPHGTLKLSVEENDTEE